MQNVAQENAAVESDKTRELSEAINRVFEFWKIRSGHCRARLDQKRRSKIRQRLVDGYTEQDIIDAIEGCRLSPWHMGTEPRGNGVVYDDIELICRDAKHVDMFIKLTEKHKIDQARKNAAAKASREEEERIQRERSIRRASSAGSPLRKVVG